MKVLKKKRAWNTDLQRWAMPATLPLCTSGTRPLRWTSQIMTQGFLTQGASPTTSLPSRSTFQAVPSLTVLQNSPTFRPPASRISAPNLMAGKSITSHSLGALQMFLQILGALQTQLHNLGVFRSQRALQFPLNCLSRVQSPTHKVQHHHR